VNRDQLKPETTAIHRVGCGVKKTGKKTWQQVFLFVLSMPEHFFTKWEVQSFCLNALEKAATEGESPVVWFNYRNLANLTSWAWTKTKKQAFIESGCLRVQP